MTPVFLPGCCSRRSMLHIHITAPRNIFMGRSKRPANNRRLAPKRETVLKSPFARTPLDSLVAQYCPGFSLPREFYSDPGVYQADIDRVWRRGWLFAGHSCEIPKPGNFFTLTVDTDL